MSSNDESRIDEREKRRRDWAARQNPELITTKQVLEMFGRISFTNLKGFLSERGIGAKIVPGFRGAYFYDKATIQELVVIYLEENPPSPRAGKRYESKVVINTTSGIIKKLPETNWPLEEFLAAWDYDFDKDAAQDITRRAPSIRLLSPNDAYDLIKVLIHLNDQRHRVIGQRYDTVFVRNALRQYIARQKNVGNIIDDQDISFVRDFLFSTYSATEVGVFDPEVVVAIIFELRLSRSSKAQG